MALPLRVFGNIDEIGCDEWSAVVHAADAPAFYSYSFLRAYQKAPLQDTSAFFYLAFGEPAVAVLPVYVQDTDDPCGDISGLGLPGRVPGDRIMLTHVVHCYDTSFPAFPHVLTPALAARGCEVVADLARQAAVKWFAFLDVDGSSALAQGLVSAGLTKIPMETRFRRELTACATVEDYVAGVPGRNARIALRRSHRQACRADMRVCAPDPGSAARDAVELCRLTTAQHGTAGYYPEQLHEFVALAEDVIGIREIRLHGELAAATICLFDRARFHMWAGGIDYEVATKVRSAYSLILWSGVEEAIAGARPILEAGRGNAAVKARFSLQPVPLFGFVGRP